MHDDIKKQRSPHISLAAKKGRVIEGKFLVFKVSFTPLFFLVFFLAGLIIPDK